MTTGIPFFAAINFKINKNELPTFSKSSQFILNFTFHLYVIVDLVNGLQKFEAPKCSRKWRYSFKFSSIDQQENNQVKPCNCRGGRVSCPLDGKWNIEKSVVYCCKVLRMDDFSTETTTGLTKGTFKERLYGDNSDLRHRKQETSTRLSK